MNRQTKRMMQRQGQMEADGSAALRRPPAPRQRQARTRTTPLEYLREVRAELRKVAWPTRAEVVNYSTVVLVTLVILVALIFVLNYGFGRGVLWLYRT